MERDNLCSQTFSLLSDEEWALVALCLTLLLEEAGESASTPCARGSRPAPDHRDGGALALAPTRPGPPASSGRSAGSRPTASRNWHTDLRAVLRLAASRDETPKAAVLDSRTLRSSPKSRARAGYDGTKRKMGSELPMAVDMLRHLLAAHVTPATADDRAQADQLIQAILVARRESVDLADVDQAIRVRGSQRQPASMASSSRWSSWLRPSAASCCRHADGSSSGPSPGRHAFGVWWAIMSASLKPSPICHALYCSLKIVWYPCFSSAPCRVWRAFSALSYPLTLNSCVPIAAAAALVFTPKARNRPAI